MAPTSQYSAEYRECANQSEGIRAGREAPNDRDGIKSPEITKWPEAIHQQGRHRAARRAHGSLEGVGGVITSEVCHLKVDISVIPEMQLF